MSRQTSNQIYGPLHFEMAEEQKLLHYHKNSIQIQKVSIILKI